MNIFEEQLSNSKLLHVQQNYEAWEFLGFETRNKYRIFDENMKPIAFAAEASTGFLGAVLRFLLKHWRSFEVHIFNNERKLSYRARFPFRWFFKALYLEDANGQALGHLQQRFAFFHKKFDLCDSRGRRIAQINSPLFKLWTFEVKSNKLLLGTIQKKWSGGLSEFFTDKDNFIVKYEAEATDVNIKAILLAATLMVDIVYFENNKASPLDLFG